MLADRNTRENQIPEIQIFSCSYGFFCFVAIFPYTLDCTEVIEFDRPTPEDELDYYDAKKIEHKNLKATTSRQAYICCEIISTLR